MGTQILFSAILPGFMENISVVEQVDDAQTKENFIY